MNERGLPDLRNSTVSCPNTGMNLAVHLGGKEEHRIIIRININV